MDSHIAHDVESIPRTADVRLVENIEFKDMFFPDPVLKGLKLNGFKKPSPIQYKAIPLARCGFDLIVQSKSGTGKTLVFVLTTLEILDLSVDRVQAIILTPTREIAVQVMDVYRAVGSALEGLKVHTFIGGLPLPNDMKALQRCQVAVGAPGRLKQLIELGHLKTDAVRLLILDEADQLMGKSFQTDINFIYWSLGEYKQVLALSATYPQELVGFLGKYLRSGRHVTPDTDPLPVLRGLSQFVSLTAFHPDPLARLTDKEKRLVFLLSSIKFNQCLVFSNYQSRAESTCNMLKCRGWSATWISGSQSQETRLSTMEQFRSSKCRVLVTTDLTSRGIDSKMVNLVINMDSPRDSRVYLHRMGRAGRYGSQGLVVTVLTEGEDLTNFRKMLGQIGGDSLYVCEIPNEDPLQDLWTTDKSELKHIYGIPPSENGGVAEPIVIQEGPLEPTVTKPERRKSAPKKIKKKKGSDNKGDEVIPTEEFQFEENGFPSLGGEEESCKDSSDFHYSEGLKGPKHTEAVPLKEGSLLMEELEQERTYCTVLQSQETSQKLAENKRKRSYSDVSEIKKTSDSCVDPTTWKLSYCDGKTEMENSPKKTQPEENTTSVMRIRDLILKNSQSLLNECFQESQTFTPINFLDITDSLKKFLQENVEVRQGEEDSKENINQNKKEGKRSKSVTKKCIEPKCEDVFEFKGSVDGKVEECNSHLNKKAKVLQETTNLNVLVSPRKNERGRIRERRRTKSVDKDIIKELEEKKPEEAESKLKIEPITLKEDKTEESTHVEKEDKGGRKEKKQGKIKKTVEVKKDRDCRVSCLERPHDTCRSIPIRRDSTTSCDLTSSSEGTYILSRSFLNSNTLPTQPSWDPWYNMYQHQLHTIYNYVQYSNYFRRRPM